MVSKEWTSMSKKLNIWSIINLSLIIALFVVVATRFSVAEANAAGTWKGYAVYRDGVVLNINDHAALMDENNIGVYKPIIHAVGYGNTVQWGTWSEFLDGNNYLGLYRPKNCTITSTLANSFISKARELRGISYNVLDQIVYSAGSSTWVNPENISCLRCDGVVEYTYEWYGYRVGGPMANGILPAI